MSQPPNTRSSRGANGTTSLIFGDRPSVRLPRRTVPICVREPIGLANPLRMASTPAMVVVLTAPRPTRRTPSLPRAGAISTGTGMRPRTISSGLFAHRHLHQKGVESIAAHVAGPDEIRSGHVQIAFRQLRIIVTVDIAPAECVEIGHHLGHDEHVERSVGVAIRVE